MRIVIASLSLALLAGVLGFTDLVPAVAAGARFLFPLAIALALATGGWQLVGRVRARDPSRVTRADLTEQPREAPEEGGDERS